MKHSPYLLATALLGIILLALPIQLTWADLRIEVTKGVDNAVRVAVVPFEWQGSGALAESISDIIDSDLMLSGRFESLPVSQMLSLPHKPEQVFNRDWRMLNVEYLVIGSVMAVADNRYRVSYSLYNVFKQAVELKQTIEGESSAHGRCPRAQSRSRVRQCRLRMP